MLTQQVSQTIMAVIGFMYCVEVVQRHVHLSNQ